MPQTSVTLVGANRLFHIIIIYINNGACLAHRSVYLCRHLMVSTFLLLGFLTAKHGMNV